MGFLFSLPTLFFFFLVVFSLNFKLNVPFNGKPWNIFENLKFFSGLFSKLRKELELSLY